MHTMWKGSISFGLVNIPIKLYAATEDKNIHMRQLHEECHTPIKYEKTCPKCEQDVQQEDIVKGYEYEKGKYVVIEPEELEELNKKQNKSIEIIDFIQLEEVDPIYFNRSYYVGPNENGEKPFSLLKKTMEDTKKIALAKITLRAKEHLAAIRVYDKGLVMETLHYPDEIRNVEHVPGVNEEVDLSDKELKMATQLVEQLTTDFKPDQYTDEYRENLMELINGKIRGEEVKIAKEVPQTDITNLMDALQESIDETKPKKKKQSGKKKQTAKKTTSKKKAKTS